MESIGEFFDKTFYGNTVLQWLISLGIIIGSIIVGKLLYWFFGNVIKKLTAKTKSKLDDILIDMLEEPIVFALTIIGIWVGINRLTFPESVNEFIYHVIIVLITINVTWLVARLVNAIIREYVVPLTEKTETDLDDQLLPLVRKGVNVVIWVIGIIVALNNANVDVGALLAGLGIGGLALAMAAKDSVSNIFGGFTIFADKPFKINDRIVLQGYDGIVQEIGIRSIRLKTLEGRMVTIPNCKVTDSAVENISMEPSRKISLKLGLTYDTDDKKMALAMDILKEIAASNDSVEENVLVGFNEFGDFALGILFIYYIKKEADILGTQTEMNMEILRRYNESGLDFAFPTQTIITEHN